MGFATWRLPKPNAPKKALQVEDKGVDKKSRGLPNIPGVNTVLWGEKLDAAKEAAERDAEPSEDMGTFPSSLSNIEEWRCNILQDYHYSSSILTIRVEGLALSCCSGGSRKRTS